ncbi:MAG: hypothetical protein RBG13Loki_2420, partial [Promethearchaeota archaeon CR_4]
VNVARNKNTPPESLVSLAGDSQWQVRQGVANNENILPMLHARLFKDSDWRVRRALITETCVRSTGDLECQLQRWELRRQGEL